MTSVQQSGWSYLIIVCGIAVLALVVKLLNRVILHFFPGTGTSHGNIGNALMRLDATFLPGGREHAIEALECAEVEQDDEGDPPSTRQRR